MIGIKKVQVVPLDINYGKIIDSDSTTDDKTQNTYSMRIVDEKTAKLRPIEVGDDLTNKIIYYDFSNIELTDFSSGRNVIRFNNSTVIREDIDNVINPTKGYVELVAPDSFEEENIKTIYETNGSYPTIGSIYGIIEFPFGVVTQINTLSPIYNCLKISNEDYSPINYKLNNDFAVINGSIVAAANTTTTDTKNYPTGFTKDNCVVISIGSSSGTLANTMCFPKFVQGSTTDVRVRLLNDNIEFAFMNASSNTINTDYIIVLMKIS